MDKIEKSSGCRIDYVVKQTFSCNFAPLHAQLSTTSLGMRSDFLPYKGKVVSEA